MKIVKRLSILLAIPFLVSICSAILFPASPKTFQQNDKAPQSAAPTKTKTPSSIVLIGTPTAIPNGIVNNNANLRSGPGTNFEIAGSVEANQSIEIIGSNSTEDWFQLVDKTWIAAFLVTDVSAPLSTLEPSSIPTAIPQSPLKQLPTLLWASVEEVEAILGKPWAITPFAAGDMSNYSGAGETRNYDWQGYSFNGYYDIAGILREIQVMDGLKAKGYKIDEWRKVIALVGLPTNIPPDGVYLAAVRWGNLDGFGVNIFADSFREKGIIIWSIQIFVQ